MKDFLKALITPFSVLSAHQQILIKVLWVSAVLGYWYSSTGNFDGNVIPSPAQTFEGLKSLWYRGLFHHLMQSLKLCFLAIGIGTVLSMIISFLSPIPLIKPVATFMSKLRFLPLTGITFFITVAITSGRAVQVWILVIFMSLYFITSLLAVIAEIPQEQYDLARTLKRSRWEMLWLVVIRGNIDRVLDVLSQNLAIAWMMLVTVESIMITSGGLGAIIRKADKHMAFDEVVAVQLIILIIGLSIDWVLKKTRFTLFPYARPQKNH